MRCTPVIAAICFIVIFSSCKVNHFVKVDAGNYLVENGSNVPEDSTILAMIRPYNEQLEGAMDEVIGVAVQDLSEGTRNQVESLLGNFVAEVLQVKAQEYTGEQVDFSIVNSGGLRTSLLPKGPIKVATIFELLPFENILVILELKGTKVRELVAHMSKNGTWPISEGLYYQMTQSGVTEIRINGELLKKDQWYKVAMPDYIANGGDEADFLMEASQISTQKLMRDAVIEFIKESPDPISAEITGRIEIKN